MEVSSGSQFPLAFHSLAYFLAVMILSAQPKLARVGLLARATINVLLLFVLTSCASESVQIKPGDVVFQSLDSPQSAAIRLATGSEYDHCGLVLDAGDGTIVVAEAVQPVRIVPLEEWIAQGVDGRYLAMRPVTVQVLSDLTLAEMLDEARAYLGRDYDITFSWTDDRMYCSEFVWKVYDRAADIQLSELRELGSFDLTHPIVQAKLQERYGDDVPIDAPVVAPSDLMESPLLTKVYEGQ